MATSVTSVLSEIKAKIPTDLTMSQRRDALWNVAFSTWQDAFKAWQELTAQGLHDAADDAWERRCACADLCTIISQIH